ncbi:hypothetical protein [Sphingobacterium faecale]|uniref:Uncharacterized protein n=1 Tax=Sphingobacterium faecale TaxID=2803775 RepID=A0ABS1QY35_9SPHI|nr:hypothetical protein [Sphingobacterium faecale]MBL1407343.1 hypothetical protein [Sphingobacterium faecale]
MKEVLDKTNLWVANVVTDLPSKHLLGSALFLLLSISATFSQKALIDFDSLANQYNVNTVVLDMEPLYEQKSEIELVNVWINDRTLLLIACLPDFRNENNVWRKLSIEETSALDINHSGLSEQIDKVRRGAHLENGYYFKLVKKINGHYFVNDHTFFQFFKIEEYPRAINTPINTINVERSFFSLKDMIAHYPELIPDESYSPMPWQENTYKVYNDRHMYGYYTSGSIDWNGKKGFKLWTFGHYDVIDGPSMHMGVGRFVYVPKIGVVGGSYDFYYYFDNPKNGSPKYHRYDISKEQWEENILSEKIAIGNLLLR